MTKKFENLKNEAQKEVSVYEVHEKICDIEKPKMSDEEYWKKVTQLSTNPNNIVESNY